MGRNPVRGEDDQIIGEERHQFRVTKAAKDAIPRGKIVAEYVGKDNAKYRKTRENKHSKANKIKWMAIGRSLGVRVVGCS